MVIADVVVVVVVVVVAVVVAIVVVRAEVAGVIIVVAGELACWMKMEQSTSPAGFCPCPLPTVRDSDPSLCLLSLLQRNRKNLEAINHTPKSLT